MSTIRPETIAAGLRGGAGSGALWLDVSGDSMGRTIVPGEAVLLRPAPRPRAGEVWAFCDARSRIVVHRSRGGRDDAWRFEGDDVGVADPAVPTAWLIGRVTAVRGPGGEVRRLGRGDRTWGRTRLMARRARRLLRRTLHRPA